MLIWKTECEWKYEERPCELRRADFGQETTWRGRVKIQSGITTAILASISSELQLEYDVEATATAQSGYGTWVWFNIGVKNNADVDLLMKEVEYIADHIDQYDG